MASHNPSPPSSSPPHTATAHPSPDLIQSTTTMPSETPTRPIPIPTPTVFNSRLVAPNLLQFKPLTCCKCNYIMLDTEWRCNLCGHDHEYMGDDRREEKYVYILESTSTSQAAEVKGNESKKTWRDAIRKVLLGIIGRGRNIAFKKQKEEEDIAKGKEEKKQKKEKKEKNKKNEKGQKGVVVSSDNTYHTLDYDENGNWVVLAGEQLVRFQVDDGAGQQVSGCHEHGEEKKKKEKEKKETTDGETNAQLKQRARKDEQQQQQQQDEGIQSSPGLFVTLVQKARAYRA